MNAEFLLPFKMINSKIAETDNTKKEVKVGYQEALIRVGEKLLNARRRTGRSQADLADACNRSRVTSLSQKRISSIEIGASEITWLEMVSIASVLGKDLNEFVP